MKSDQFSEFKNLRHDFKFPVNVKLKIKTNYCLLYQLSLKWGINRDDDTIGKTVLFVIVS